MFLRSFFSPILGKFLPATTWHWHRTYEVTSHCLTQYAVVCEISFREKEEASPDQILCTAVLEEVRAAAHQITARTEIDFLRCLEHKNFDIVRKCNERVQHAGFHVVRIKIAQTKLLA